MKNILLILSFIALFSCNNDDTSTIPTTSVSFNFTHNWDGTSVTNANFSTLQYFNENGDELSIERLRYLISKITFHQANGETIVIDGYNLIDVTSNENLVYAPAIQIPIGTYTNVSYTFGFNNDDNIDGAYTDLNSATWNVPMMMGGGYHFMQLEGKFLNNVATEQNYQYHTIKAVNNSDPMNLVFQDTFFTVDLGSVIVRENASVEIKMNISEWFKNPNLWDLNLLNSMLMPNFDAQVKMSQNGKNAFSLGNVTQ